MQDRNPAPTKKRRVYDTQTGDIITTEAVSTLSPFQESMPRLSIIVSQEFTSTIIKKAHKKKSSVNLGEIKSEILAEIKNGTSKTLNMLFNSYPHHQPEITQLAIEKVSTYHHLRQRPRSEIQNKGYTTIVHNNFKSLVNHRLKKHSDKNLAAIKSDILAEIQSGTSHTLNNLFKRYPQYQPEITQLAIKKVQQYIPWKYVTSTSVPLSFQPDLPAITTVSSYAAPSQSHIQARPNLHVSESLLIIIREKFGNMARNRLAFAQSKGLDIETIKSVILAEITSYKSVVLKNILKRYPDYDQREIRQIAIDKVLQYFDDKVDLRTPSASHAHSTQQNFPPSQALTRDSTTEKEEDGVDIESYLDYAVGIRDSHTLLEREENPTPAFYSDSSFGLFQPSYLPNLTADEDPDNTPYYISGNTPG